MQICWPVDSPRLVSLQRCHTCAATYVEESHVDPHWRKSGTRVSAMIFRWSISGNSQSKLRTSRNKCDTFGSIMKNACAPPIAYACFTEIQYVALWPPWCIYVRSAADSERSKGGLIRLGDGRVKLVLKDELVAIEFSNYKKLWTELCFHLKLLKNDLYHVGSIKLSIVIRNQLHHNPPCLTTTTTNENCSHH